MISRSLASRARGISLGALLTACGASSVPRETSPGGDVAARKAAAGVVASAADELWTRRLEDDPLERTKVGLPLTEFPDLSEAHFRDSVDLGRRLLARLEAVDDRALEDESRITRDVVRWEAHLLVEQRDFYWFAFAITPYSSLFGAAPDLFAGYVLTTRAEGERYLALLARYADFVEATRVYVRGQAQRGILLPSDEIPIVIDFVSAYAKPAGESPFRVDPARIRAWGAEAAAAFQRSVADLIERRVTPAFAALRDDVANDYAKRAPLEVGLAQYPKGGEFYALLVKFHLTMEISPEAVHRRGLDAVAEDEAKMTELRRSLGFAGSARDFLSFLRSDPRFFVKTPAELETRVLAYTKRIEPRVPAFFTRTPNAPYAVKRLDPALEGGQTFGHYEPPTPSDPVGHYFYNSADLEHRSVAMMGPVILHELIPGHHFQMNLASENTRLIPLRREASYSAYVEGWACYASYLGIEMGAYIDPYDLYSQLELDNFAAVRMVVDTGMNALGWSRARASEYMKAHSARSDREFASETLRYGVDMPGQALAYKVGESEILRMRDETKRRLGARFNLPRFHDCVLGEGALPLLVLDRHVRECMNR